MILPMQFILNTELNVLEEEIVVFFLDTRKRQSIKYLLDGLELASLNHLLMSLKNI